MKILIIWLSLSFFCVSVCEATDDCKKLVLDAYEKVSAAGHTTGGKYQLLEFRTITYYKLPGENKVKTSETATRLVNSGDQMHLTSNDTELIKDKKLAVAVLRKQKQILISQATAPTAVTNSQMEVIRNLLLKEAKLESCQSLEGGKIQVASFQLPEHLIAQYQIKKMKFWIQGGRVIKIDLNYSANQPIERHIVEFLKQENNSPKPANVYSKPADLVFDNYGKLLPAYKGFQIIDTRG